MIELDQNMVAADAVGDVILKALKTLSAEHSLSGRYH